MDLNVGSPSNLSETPEIVPPLNQKKKNRKGKISSRYNDEDLIEAIEAVKSKRLNQREAARRYNVPRTTLQDRVNNIRPLERTHGPKTILTPEEEATLKNYIIVLMKCGFPRPKGGFIYYV